MTPLALAAARVAREAGDFDSFDVLCGFQWFDVNAIEPMIDVAIGSNRSIEALAGAPYPPWSSRARLPAKCSWFEAARYGSRCAWVCSEIPAAAPGEAPAISVRLVTPTLRYPRVIFRAGDKGVKVERGDWGKTGPDGAQFIAEQVEAILNILNQPQLIETRKVPCHKREARAAQLRGYALGDAGLWTICAIRPGKHGMAYGGPADAATRPLHHVRKHYKPRQSAATGREIWIDDYWRGNADLGIINKTYVVKPPKLAA